MAGADALRRVPVQACKNYANPHDRGEMPEYFQAGLTHYMFKRG